MYITTNSMHPKDSAIIRVAWDSIANILPLLDRTQSPYPRSRTRSIETMHIPLHFDPHTCTTSSSLDKSAW
jgi:hypothetical protein